MIGLTEEIYGKYWKNRIQDAKNIVATSEKHLRLQSELIKSPPRISEIEYNGYPIGILRLDELHPEISGNKWFKLKYNLAQAQAEEKNAILTFGGAYSNHIAATAASCKLAGFKSIGIIRGEKTASNNPTLSAAQQNGMQLLFVDREQYRRKTETQYLQALQQQFPEAYIVPEGGDNELGQKGCEEILSPETRDYTSAYCAFGTGATFKGIAKSLLPHQKLTAINVLKFDAVSDFKNATINNNYHFGGYAKHTQELLDFKSWFEITYKISLDYVYNSKLFFAVFDLINQQKINKNEKLLIIHCGGLQGNKGYAERNKL